MHINMLYILYENCMFVMLHNLVNIFSKYFLRCRENGGLMQPVTV